MNKIYKKIVHSFMFGIILSITALFCIAVISFINKSIITGVLCILLCLALWIYTIITRQLKRKELDECLSLVSKDAAVDNIISTLPLPTAVMRLDGSIIWYNKLFSNIFGDNLFDVPISSIISDLRWSDVLKSTNGIYKNISFDNCKYEVSGEFFKTSDAEEASIVLYFFNHTVEEDLRTKYNNEKIDIAIINIDNYEEMFQRIDESKRQQILTEIDKYVTEWVSESHGLRRRTDRDCYLVLFEHQYLQNYIDKKFDVIDKVRAIGETLKQPITISIGIGVSGNIFQNDEYARAALDLALGRGGDQAIVKDDTQYRYYGGNTKEYEKSTRLKVRSVSFALKDLILHADKIFLMGHKTPDYDSFGSMMGLQRVARSLGKQAYIILDNTIGIHNLITEANTMPEYNDLFIDADAAIELSTNDSLIIIVDTHRPSMVPCEDLLTRVKKKVLIDHHRRNSEFINDCSLIYHEPYASSTCEMTAEIMQYINNGSNMNQFEAKSLYVGLLMDTKNFVMKTSARTFDAASYLKNFGIDTTATKSLFNIDKDDYVHKVDIVKAADIFNENISISVCKETFPNVRVISSQAADEMLTIGKTRASFVIFSENGDVGISGRSLGDINVQVILEKLGGGGHMTVAGAKITGGIDAEQVREMLISAITSYLDENSDTKS